MNSTFINRTRKDGTKIEVSCPNEIEVYNIMVGGWSLWSKKRKIPNTKICKMVAPHLLFLDWCWDCKQFYSLASKQKKQESQPANIPNSISSTANRRLFFMEEERMPCYLSDKERHGSRRWVLSCWKTYAKTNFQLQKIQH